MKNTPLPKSKAKTAYGLLSSICNIVTEEPKRLAMDTWHTVRPVQEGYKAPACGTVACIGGWVQTLRPGRVASETMGITSAQFYELFHDSLNSGRLMAQEPQTRRHARAVVAHIRRFQKKYAKQLKAKRV